MTIGSAVVAASCVRASGKRNVQSGRQPFSWLTIVDQIGESLWLELGKRGFQVVVRPKTAAKGWSRLGIIGRT